MKRQTEKQSHRFTNLHYFWISRFHKYFPTILVLLFLLLFSIPRNLIADENQLSSSAKIPLHQDTLLSIDPSSRDFTITSKSEHHPLLDQTYSPYSTQDSPLGKGWAASHQMKVIHKNDRLTLLSPHGEPIASFREPVLSSKSGPYYRSPTSTGEYESTRPVPLRLAKTPTSFVLNMPGGVNYEFSLKGDLQRIYSPSKSTEEKLIYSPKGLLEKISSSDGKEVRLSYSSDDKHLESIESAKGKTTFNYTDSGYLQQVLHPNGSVDLLTYDSRGRMEKYTSSKAGTTPQKSEFSYTSENSGHLSEVRSPSGTRKFKYLPHGLEVSDEQGVLYRIENTRGGKEILAESPQSKTRYTLDDARRVKEMEIHPAGKDPYRVNFTYAPSGHIIKVQTTRLKDGITGEIALQHDTYGRLTGVKGEGDVGVEFKYPESPGGMISSLKEEMLSYSYNTHGQLTAAKGDGTTHQLNYDSDGHLQSMVSTSSGASEKIEVVEDAKGGLESVKLADGNKYKLHYDGERLTSFAREGGEIVQFRRMKNFTAAMKKEYCPTLKKWSEIPDPESMMDGKSKESYAAILRDKQGVPRVLVRDDGQYRLLTHKPVENYTPPKGWGSRFADWLDKGIDTARDWYGEKLKDSDFLQFSSEGAAALLKTSTDSLRLGEGMYRATEEIGKGNYATALMETGVEGLRIWGLAGGSGSVMKRGLGSGSRLISKAGSGSRKPLTSLAEMEKRLLGGSREVAKSGEGIKSSAEALKTVKGEVEKKIGNASVEEGMITNLSRMESRKLRDGAEKLKNLPASMKELQDIYL